MVKKSGEVGSESVLSAAKRLERDAKELSEMLSGQVARIEGDGPVEVDEPNLYEAANAVERARAAGGLFIDTVDAIDFSSPKPEQKPEPEEDFELGGDRAFRLACEFVQGKNGMSFTPQELKIYLRRRRIELPENAKEFNELFTNWRDEILGMVHEQTGAASWAGPKLLGRGNFALAVGPGKKFDLMKFFETMESKKAASVIQVPVRLSGDPRALGIDAPEQPAPYRKPGREELHLESAMEYAVESPGLKAKTIIEQFAEKQGIPVAKSAELYKKLEEENRLFSNRIKGTRFFSLEAPAPRKTTKEKREKESETLTEKQIGQAVVILRAFTTLDIRQRLAPREVLNEAINIGLDTKGLNQESIKRISRRLKDLGIMVFGESTQGGKAPRKKQRNVFKVGISHASIKAKLKKREGRTEIMNLIRDNKPFEPEKQV